MISTQDKATPQKGQPTPPAKVSDSAAEFLEKAEAKVDEISAAVTNATGEARVQAHLGLMELADTWRQAQSSLAKQIGRLKDGAVKARAAVDTAKVRTHLAKADAADAVDELRSRLERIEKRLEALVTRGEEQTRDALERLSKSCHELSNKLRDT